MHQPCFTSHLRINVGRVLNTLLGHVSQLSLRRSFPVSHPVLCLPPQTKLLSWTVGTLWWLGGGREPLSVVCASLQPSRLSEQFIKSLNLDYRHPTTQSLPHSTFLGPAACCVPSTVNYCNSLCENIWLIDWLFQSWSHFLLFMNYLRQLWRAEAPRVVWLSRKKHVWGAVCAESVRP